MAQIPTRTIIPRDPQREEHISDHNELARLHNELDTADVVTTLDGKVDKGSLVVNVKDYGAVGDGTTDDTTAVQAAINSISSGIILFPVGSYRITAPITLTGAKQLIGAGTNDSGSRIDRDFSGNLFVIEGSVIMSRLFLYDASSDTTRTGAALRLQAVVVGGDPNTATLTRRAQFCAFNEVRVSSAAAGGVWERIVDADGSNYTPTSGAGIRNIFFNDCYLFGARTVEETIRVNVGTNWWFSGGGIYAAPTSINQGVSLLSNSSAGIHFSNFQLAGRLYSEADRHTFVGGYINAGCELAATATNSVVDTVITGTITNGNNTSNLIRSRGQVFGTESYRGLVAGTEIVSAQVPGDTGDRMRLTNNGALLMGPGNATFDVQLSRLSTNIGRLTGEFQSTLDTKARVGTAQETRIGAAGPSGNDAGLRLGSAVDATIYREGAARIAVPTDHTIKTGRNTTANRPSASTVGQGAMFFDTTLNKPIWSDGTNWRDAAGTVV